MKNTTIVLLFFISVAAKTQDWQIESVNAGWKVFELELVGTNPHTIVSQLKNPFAYLQNLSTIPYNSLTGFPVVVGFDNYYVGLELRNSRATKFWHRHRIPIGIVFTGVNQYPTGSISFIDFDTLYSRYENAYRVYRKIQFIGIHSGLIRKFRLRENFFFVSGVQGQISVAFKHTYQEVYDTTIYRQGIGFSGNSRAGNTLAGKNYLQWQLYIPLALEYHAFRQRISIKAEVSYGLLKNPFIGNTLADMESAGAGFTIGYRFSKKQGT